MAAPAGAAHRLTTRPFLGLALAAILSLASVWLGLVLSYVVPSIPPSFAILAIATTTYGVALAIPQPHSGRGEVSEGIPSEVEFGHPVLWRRRFYFALFSASARSWYATSPDCAKRMTPLLSRT